MHPVSLNYLTNLKNHWISISGNIMFSPPSERGSVADDNPHSSLIEYLQTTFGEDRSDEITTHAWDSDYWLAQLEQRLYEDLESYCSEEELAVLRQAAVAYLPVANADAFAGHVPHAPENHVIAVHLSLIWVSFLLSEALLLAAEDHHELARQKYQIALKGYLKNNFIETFNAWSGSLHDDDKLLAHSGAVGTVLLRFVGLHELGHLVLGHVDQADMRYSGETGEVHYYQSEELGESGVWAIEYAADRFAIDHMLAHTGGLEQMWNNLLFIGAFFRFIEHLELLKGRPLSRLHPPPTQRLQALSERVTEVLGPPPNDAQRWAEAMLLEWRS